MKACAVSTVGICAKVMAASNATVKLIVSRISRSENLPCAKPNANVGYLDTMKSRRSVCPRSATIGGSSMICRSSSSASSHSASACKAAEAASSTVKSNGSLASTAATAAAFASSKVISSCALSAATPSAEYRSVTSERSRFGSYSPSRCNANSTSGMSRAIRSAIEPGL